jgi:hypothetical protein
MRRPRKTRKTRNSLLAGLTKNQQRGLVNALVQYAQSLNAEESRNAVTPSFNHGGIVCVFCGSRAGWFHDDGPDYITEVDGRQNKNNRSEGPSVLIEVFKDAGDEKIQPVDL